MKLQAFGAAILAAVLVACGGSNSTVDAGPVGGFDAGPQPECDAGQSLCGSMCISTQSDVQNCGSCQNVCTVANGVPGCTTGYCIVAGCDAGFADCDLNYQNGCEINTASDPNNCGSCKHACTTPATCVNGMCQ